MAYYPGKMVSGLCLHSAGRKPERICKNGFEPSGGVDFNGSMAWKHAEFYVVGAFSVVFYRPGKDGGKGSKGFTKEKDSGKGSRSFAKKKNSGKGETKAFRNILAPLFVGGHSGYLDVLCQRRFFPA